MSPGVNLLGWAAPPPHLRARRPEGLCGRGHVLFEANLVASALPDLSCRSCSAGRAARTYARVKGLPPIDIQAAADRFYNKLLKARP